MKVTLTPLQKQSLEREHKMTHDKRVCDRIKAVLLASEGWSIAMIAQALRLSESTILRHLNDFHQSQKLKPENGGSQSFLLPHETQHLLAHLSQHPYTHVQAIVDDVQHEFGVLYSVSGMTKWLHQNGFRFKKFTPVPKKTDVEKQLAFIESYQALKESCGDNETILFMDAVHPTQATKVTHGWIPKGQNSVIQTTGSRTRMNLIGALPLNAIEDTVIEEYEHINKETIVHFFFELRTRYPRSHKLHLILDGAGYHCAEIVKDAAYLLNIELHYQPPYCPNLNIIERLWKVMNEQVRNNVYFANKQDFHEAIHGFFEEKLPKMATDLKSLLTDNFQIINPA